MTPYRAVLFDFFGTLTRAVVRGPWHLLVARQLGCEPARLTAVLDGSFRLRASGRFGSAEGTLRWLCYQLAVDPPAKVRQDVLRALVAGVRADTRLRPDASATLTAVRDRGLRTAVVSDCGYELPRFLPELPIAGLLDACVYSVEVGQCKPHPATYATACQRLRVLPEQCLYVGDGGSRELTGAVSAGMTAVRLAAPDLSEHLVYAPDREFTGPQVRSLTEVVRLLDRPATPALRFAPVRSGGPDGASRASGPDGAASGSRGSSTPAAVVPAGNRAAAVTSPP